MIEELIDKLIHHDIEIELIDEDKLKIHTGLSNIPGHILEEIKGNKENLINYLKNHLVLEDYRKIPVTELCESYLVSSTQRRLWVLSQFEGSNIAYNIPRTQILEGKFDPDALLFSFRVLIERHESLRTTFRVDDSGEVRQFVHSPDASKFRFEHHDLRDLNNKEEKLRDFTEKEFITSFDLSSGPLMRASLCQLSNTRWEFIYVMHHIISDGWSMNILIKELLLIYHSYNSGKPIKLPALRIQYRDYAAWQNIQVNSKYFQSHRAYWLKQFEGALPVLAFPGDKARPVLKTYNGSSICGTINSEVAAALRAICQEQSCTLFMGLLAAVTALLYRYTDQDDIIIGSPIAGREHADLAEQIGFYANTLALRIRFDRSDCYKDLLMKVKEVCLGAYDHQSYPFDKLIDELEMQRDATRNPLFDIMMVLEENETGGADGHELGMGEIIRNEEEKKVITKFDLTFNFAEKESKVLVTLEFNTDIINLNTAKRVVAHFEQLIAELVGLPSCSIGDLTYLNNEERDQLINGFNDTVTDLLENNTVTELFEQQVARTPEKTALVFINKHTCYRELNERANQLGDYLRTHYDVRADDLVAIRLRRSEEMIISILGVLKSGAAYIPIDPDYPKERVNYILKQSGCKACIDITEWIKFDNVKEHYNKSNPVQINKPSDLIYVIYTSGSTGKPKGCMLEHRGIVNRLAWMWDHYNFGEDDVILQKTTFTFDVSVWEIFMPLCRGAKMVLCQDEDIRSPERILNIIEESGITCLHFVPSVLNVFIATLFDGENLGNKLKSLRRLITSGEALAIDSVKNWYAKTNVPIHNLYGPTEASVDVTYYETSKYDISIPIGRPIWNTQIYVTDTGDQLLPVGVVGEISIGGIGLARGYLNEPLLTADKFRSNPFRDGEKVYKTGDLGRWLPNGNIEFMGRKDDQVKINGFRIEAQEIVNLLNSYAHIESSIVLTKTGNNNERDLIAYIVSKQTLKATDLRNYLRLHLPSFMIPNHFVQIAEMPLTSNGKIDRICLVQMQGIHIESGLEHIEPKTELEKQIVVIWQEILSKDKVGVGDDFFELGGSSLKAMRIIKKVMDLTGIGIPIKVLFEQKTIVNILACVAETGSGIKLSPYEDSLGGQNRLYDASYNQLAFFSEWDRSGDHLIVSYYDYQELNVEAFTLAIHRLVERHEILRTVFIEIDGKIKQKIIPFHEFEFDIQTHPGGLSEADKNAIINKEYERKFDLFKSPLFTVKFLRTENGGFVVLLTMHHIIVDGHSGGVIRTELAALYEDIVRGAPTRLLPLSFQYADFSNWQLKFLFSTEGDRHKEYWFKRLIGVNQRIAIPFRNPEVSVNKGNVIGSMTLIQEKEYMGLGLFCKENGITYNVLLMGVLIILLNQISKQNDITIFTPVSGRNSRFYGKLDVSDLIGFFTNFLPVRNQIDTQKSVIEYLHSVQSNFLQDLSYDAYPIDKLVGEIPGITKSNFLDSTVFYNYHNYSYLTSSIYKMDEAGKEAKKPGDGEMNQAFILAVTEFKNCLRLHFIFNEHFFDFERRTNFKDHFLAVLGQVIYSHGKMLRQIKCHPII